MLDHGLDDTLEAIREEMRKFTDSEVMPCAHGWHLSNSYIPLEVIAHMAELGVFGPVVNLAARLEGMTKQFRVPILVDENVAAYVASKKHCGWAQMITSPSPSISPCCWPVFRFT